MDDEVTCQEFVELVTAYFEGTLDTPTLSQAEEHLVMCDWCVTYLEQMQTTIAALARLTDATPADPSEVVLTALRTRESG
jgi:predicted anti-sigma-YlaC factor YlaD